MANSTSTQINSSDAIRSDEFGEEDRLSSLPDAILIKILSNLQILGAVKTSVLSRRFRNLWKGVTSTTFEFYSPTMNFEFAAFIIRRLTSPNIRVFKYCYDNDTDYFYWQFQSAGHCYYFLISQNVETIQVSSKTDLPVPDCLFNCESLVSLDLNGYLDWTLQLDEVHDLPINGATINLPNLKKLLLRVNETDYCLLRTLLKFCPNLEDLSLKLDLCHEHVVLEIVAPNLKSLNIDTCVPILCSHTLIDAPQLSKLKILDPCSYYKFKSIPTSLVEAAINFRCLGDDEIMDCAVEDHVRVVSKFIRGMTSVSCLKLHSYPNLHTYFGSVDDDEVMPVFDNLTFFQTTMDTLEVWENLLCTLHCFPNLKHLELKMVDFHISWPRYRCAPIVLPDCLLTKLKRITMKKSERTNAEIKLVEFILNHAKVLDELCIYASTVEFCKAIQLWDEYKFCQALFKLSKSSLTCKIVFSGVYINASSNAFQEGLIGCQIRCSEKLADSEYYKMF